MNIQNTRAVVEPPRIARLPKDKRGYPVPYNVLRGRDGQPIFTVNDDQKAWRCVREERCPICGGKLGRWRWCAGGPLSAFHPNGFYYDLPMHRDCVEYAMKVCPYLAMPKYLGGRLDAYSAENAPENVALVDVTSIPERPEIFVALCGDTFETRDRFPLTPLLRPMKPWHGWTFWRHGKELNTYDALPYLQNALGQDWQPPWESVK